MILCSAGTLINIFKTFVDFVTEPISSPKRLILQDRVKRQRLSGQSGVGSDFKEWRSEEEMRQRQMYD